MINKHLFCNLLLFLCLKTVFLSAQNAGTPIREADFTSSNEGKALRFHGVLPSLSQIAGAPQAYYSYHWEFGDGTFSTEPEPLHLYPDAGDYTAVLDVTNNYDDGKVPRKKKKKVAAIASSGGPAAIEGVFKKEDQSIALKANRDTRAGEEIILTLSYRNKVNATTDGRLYLFYNEKKYANRHFTFVESRTHFGETGGQGNMSFVPTELSPFDKMPQWATHLAGNSALFLADAPAPAATELLARSRSIFREEQSWQFADLAAGARRNIFISLLASEKMLKDTSATIHLRGIFDPFNPALRAEEFTLDIEIVASHDPNVISVSDARVNYRTLGSKDLDYKVKFQNNGEGPAKVVQVTISVPDGLDLAKMKPSDWYPKCPICPKTATAKSCLDTATTKDGLIFTFRNIYLPGSRQKGVDDIDSTKGFVKYRIEPEHRMPKRAFRSRAAIVFDKNPPITTNFSKTRFKPGISPGIKAGYGFHPDSLQSGYLFLGASLSPYQSWKIYPQIELLTGLKGQTNLPTDTAAAVKYTIQLSGRIADSVVTTISAGTRGFVSVEVPFLLRKNFSRLMGVGLGGSARYTRSNGENQVTEQYDINVGNGPDIKTIRSGKTQKPATVYADSRIDYAVFVDLTLGFVRAGPNIGLRAGYHLGQKGQKQPFVQASIEVKL